MDRYTKEVHKIMKDKTPAPPTTKSREELEMDIAAISMALLGPHSNLDRLDLVESRQMLRKQLALLGG